VHAAAAAAQPHVLQRTESCLFSAVATGVAAANNARSLCSLSVRACLTPTSPASCSTHSHTLHTTQRSLSAWAQLASCATPPTQRETRGVLVLVCFSCLCVVCCALSCMLPRCLRACACPPPPPALHTDTCIPPRNFKSNTTTGGASLASASTSALTATCWTTCGQQQRRSATRSGAMAARTTQVRVAPVLPCTAARAVQCCAAPPHSRSPRLTTPRPAPPPRLPSSLSGHYNARSWETGFFKSQGGRWQSDYGDFFQSWYRCVVF
jgi:hypothetical protein